MVVQNRPLTTVETLLRQIAEELQLTATLDANVRSHYAALVRYLGEGMLAEQSPALYAQGSFRIGTTVRPVVSEEFDLDFVCEFQAPVATTADVVYEALARVIQRSDVYGPKSERRPRCIRIQFADHCHVDIVPAIPDAVGGGTCILIPDRMGERWTWRATNPKGYAAWFEGLQVQQRVFKALSAEPLPPPQEAEAKSPLQVAVQLLKRNHQTLIDDEKLRTPSIVHTTIVGNHAAGLSTIVETFDAAVAATQSYAERPRHVEHPAHADEILSEKWTDDKIFGAYRDYARALGEQWAAAKAAEGNGYAAVMPLLYAMFGEAPVMKALKTLTERTKSLSDAGRLKTAAAGGLTATAAGLGNPRKTFFGDDL